MCAFLALRFLFLIAEMYLQCFTVVDKLNSRLNSSDVALELSGRSTALVQSVVLCNYTRGGPGLRGLLLDFTRKVPVHYMNLLKKSTPHLCIGLSKN